MKQFDKIYVLAPSDQWTMDGGFKLYEDGFVKSTFVGEVNQMSDVVVLTVNELKNIWQAGRAELDHEQFDATDFKTYFKERGIEV